VSFQPDDNGESSYADWDGVLQLSRGETDALESSIEVESLPGHAWVRRVPRSSPVTGWRQAKQSLSIYPSNRDGLGQLQYLSQGRLHELGRRQSTWQRHR
jgi:hypothetical protein